MAEIQNSNPTILNVADLPTRSRSIEKSNDHAGIFAAIANPADFLSDPESDDDLLEEPIDEQEIYDLIKSISDPEHPISLGELAVVSLPDISIKRTLPNIPDSPLQTVTVLVTPTITHCSLATVIGLGVRVRLEQSLPSRFRVDVRIKEGTHSTGDEVNKQLGDKERVAAALENGALMQVIAKMMETCQ
ncbi:MIP18 family protein [Penicillium taxi]|uniref:MIP18 family protein n=1 Tax=Penicillium taxi TaxID=168475 RepID=UPI002544EE73|nr:MIP18 family protein [Penicillium taxi]KAJ5902428.1 MIP18 family protein [Penicillium taxi]